MLSLADHHPDNNTLYPHDPQLLVNRDSHEQNMQALSPGHHVDNRDKPYTQSSAKLNRTEKGFGTYQEVTSDEDISSEEFTHKTQGRLPMTTGWVQQDQFKGSWSRGRADDPYQYDQMPD